MQLEPFDVQLEALVVHELVFEWSLSVFKHVILLVQKQFFAPLELSPFPEQEQDSIKFVFERAPPLPPNTPASSSALSISPG